MATQIPSQILRVKKALRSISKVLKIRKIILDYIIKL